MGDKDLSVEFFCFRSASYHRPHQIFITTPQSCSVWRKIGPFAHVRHAYSSSGCIPFHHFYKKHHHSKRTHSSVCLSPACYIFILDKLPHYYMHFIKCLSLTCIKCMLSLTRTLSVSLSLSLSLNKSNSISFIGRSVK